MFREKTTQERVKREIIRQSRKDGFEDKKRLTINQNYMQNMNMWS